MYKAYDSILCLEINAASIAKNTSQNKSDYFRYKCLCCGEDVYLAAADSSIKTPHFRHRRGNNDTECEEYLGQPGAIERSVSIRNRSQDSVAFFFNSDRKTFELAISLKREYLEDLSSRHATLELKRSYTERAFLSVPIDNTNFVADTIQHFTINEYSNNYYLNLSGDISTGYRLFDYNKLSFFRSRMQNECSKKVFSDYLFINTRYVAVCEEESNITRLVSFENVQCISEPIKFTTMGKKFYSVEISFLKRSYDLNSFLLNHGFKLAASETLSILWPPVFMKDSDYVCEDDRIFVKSSFPLVFNGNTNAKSTADELPQGITQIKLENKTIIKEKNIDVSLIKLKEEQYEVIQNEIVSEYTSQWIVSDDMDYFLFDQCGCRKLTVNEKVYLTENDRIAGYRNNHLKRIILSVKKSVPSAEFIINDILKYYPQSDSYKLEDFLGLSVCEPVITYLEKCYRNGRVNTIVKKYIEEGLL